MLSINEEIYLDDIKITTAPAAPLTLYDDKLAQDVTDWSWNSTNNFTDTNSPYNGTAVASSTFTSGYGGLRLNHWRGFSTDGYQYLTFAIKSSIDNLPVTVQFTDQQGNGIGTAKPLNTYGSSPISAAYIKYEIPIAHLNPPTPVVHGIIIQEQSGTAPVTIKVDDLRLIGPLSNGPDVIRENQFTYDNLGRLLTANYNAQRSYSYTYDAVGNRTVSNENGVQSTYTYNNDNQMLTKTGRTFTYDNQGNQTGDSSKVFTYDFDSRLKKHENPSTNVTTEFKYDHAGNRIEKKTGTMTHQFVNDTTGDLARVLVDKNTTNNTQNYYIYGADIISQGATAQGDRQYYLPDGQGNVRYVADGVGSAIQAYAYDPYGNEVDTSPLSNFTFQEQQKDRETNLTYLRARYYDSTTGRFTAKDPVEGLKTNPQSQNGYSYAHNDPVNLSDPSGELIPLLVAGGFYVWSAWDVYRGWKNCDSSQLGTGAIGLLPGVGQVSKGGKAIKTLKELPGARYSRGPDAAQDAYNHLQKYHGVDPATASNRLHAIKSANGLRGADNVIIGSTGDVYNVKTNEYLGSLTDSTWGR